MGDSSLESQVELTDMSTSSLTIPRKSGLPREIFKWLQSLDLAFPVHNVRRDFSNGYLVGEIFSYYYNGDIEMHSFNNGTSLQNKLGNWSLLQRFFIRQELNIPKDVVNGTIHCKQGAAELLVVYIYSILTKRVVRGFELASDADCEFREFTDSNYQFMLPMHARSTTSTAIKNNMKITEFITEPNIITNMEKAEGIIKRHTEHRRIQREQDPTRFKIKPTLADLAFRNSPREHSKNNSKFQSEDSSSSAAPLGDTATVLQSLTSS